MIIKSINRVKTNNETRFIVDFNNSKKVLSLTIDDLELFTDAFNAYYWDMDIDNYLDENIENENYHEDILKDTELINDFRNAYYEARSNADGGELEASMHWSECLSTAADETIEPVRFVYDPEIRSEFKTMLSENYDTTLFDDITLLRNIMCKIESTLTENNHTSHITAENFFNTDIIKNVLDTFKDEIAKYVKKV